MEIWSVFYGFPVRGEVVIPAELRRGFNIKSRVILKVENNEIKIVPFMDLRGLLGSMGKVC